MQVFICEAMGYSRKNPHPYDGRHVYFYWVWVELLN